MLHTIKIPDLSQYKRIFQIPATKVLVHSQQLIRVATIQCWPLTAHQAWAFNTWTKPQEEELDPATYSTYQLGLPAEKISSRKPSSGLQARTIVDRRVPIEKLQRMWKEVLMCRFCRFRSNRGTWALGVDRRSRYRICSSKIPTL